MEFLKKYNLTPKKILKLGGLGIAGLIGLVFVFQLVSSFNLDQRSGISDLAGSKNLAYDSTQSLGGAGVSESLDEVGLSLRNIAPSGIPAPSAEVTTGSDAEDFEVTEYSGLIETRQLEETCSVISNLKEKNYVIFENSNKYDKGCNYDFKVENENASEILAVIESLDPKELSENVYTVKKRIEDFTSELDILNKKKQSIDETLESAILAYDSITKIASQSQDAESLAKIIDSKIKIIERLTQERISINEQIDRYSRLKAEQLDRLEYTYFHINVSENKYVDLEDIKDSWKYAIKNFIANINGIAQDVTVNLAALVLFMIQYAIYLLILLIFAKYGWQLTIYIWKK